MTPADFSFVTRWTFDHDRDHVWGVLNELVESDDPAAWWRSVSSSRPDEDSLQLVVRSVLGYRLRIRVHDLRITPPATMRFRADGDLVGRGVLTAVATGPGTTGLVVEWDVTVTRPWMRRTSRILRPGFVAAHHVVMWQARRQLGRVVDAG